VNEQFLLPGYGRRFFLLAVDAPQSRATDSALAFFQISGNNTWSLKMKAQVALIALASAALLDPSASVAQDAADVGHGREIARTICAACHVVSKGEVALPGSEAPSFLVLAATPGMTTIALTAALLTSHRRMPNIILQPDERRDVAAYILSLK
jgi:mono/diheme cytochrome c family protein